MPTATRFALIGAAGYIAPRHMKAIRAVGGDLEAAFDPSDSVGTLDSYFPDARFFTDFAGFARHVAQWLPAGITGHVSICSPNHRHREHMRFSLEAGCNVICEKPLVLDPAHLDELGAIEAKTGGRISTILQLRLHPAIMALREAVRTCGRRHQVDLTYVTSRGPWYDVSWKGDEARSGGIATNIGVHFFDMLSFVFGPLQFQRAHLREARRAAGFFAFAKADVRWFLSVERSDVPERAGKDAATYRSITVDGEEIEFSDRFTDLHTRSYERILAGEGYGLAEARGAVELTAAFRTLPLERDRDARHPMLAAVTGT